MNLGFKLNKKSEEKIINGFSITEKDNGPSEDLEINEKGEQIMEETKTEIINETEVVSEEPSREELLKSIEEYKKLCEKYTASISSLERANRDLESYMLELKSRSNVIANDMIDTSKSLLKTVKYITKLLSLRRPKDLKKGLLNIREQLSHLIINDINLVSENVEDNFSEKMKDLMSKLDTEEI